MSSMTPIPKAKGADSTPTLLLSLPFLIQLDLLWPTSYIVYMTYEIETTAHFDKWARKLKDQTAARAIAARLARVRAGVLR